MFHILKAADAHLAEIEAAGGPFDDTYDAIDNLFEAEHVGPDVVVVEVAPATLGVVPRNRPEIPSAIWF